MITQCCIHELYVAGRSQQAAVDLAKTFERRRCNHMEPIPGDECVTSVVGASAHLMELVVYSEQGFDAGETNKHRYVVATQSQSLRIRLRSIPAVPIVHVNRSVMVLEPPSDATVKAKKMVGIRTKTSYALNNWMNRSRKNNFILLRPIGRYYHPSQTMNHLEKGVKAPRVQIHLASRRRQ